MTATAPTASRRLYRSTRDKKLGGVCGGIAEVMAWDPTAVRLAAVLLLLLPGPQFLAYIVAWIVMPTDEQIFGWPTAPAQPPVPPMPSPPYGDPAEPTL
ncbi:MAG TPA: PspC domain-containing protein [Euzebya sp.]|nr:PspC domain-containing protein [Euzebya sp.]